MIAAKISVWRSEIEPDLDKLTDYMQSILRSELHGLNVEAITHRKKTAASIQQKLQTGKYNNVGEVRDIAALTVVVLYRRDIPRAIDILKSSQLQIDDPGPASVSPSDFRYHEPKLFIRPPVEYLDRNELQIEECEVQFTTVLQHALDAATHDFDYKGQSYAWSNFRLVAQLRGMLEMVDRTIDAIEESDLTTDCSVKPPARMIAVSELLQLLSIHFDHRLPSDKRRFAETVHSWLESGGIGLRELDQSLSNNPDLVGSLSLDATSATLGSLLRGHPQVLDNYKGRVLVTEELSFLCPESAALPDKIKVAI